MVEKIERDRETFTQGIKYHRGQFYESAGLYNKSGVYRYIFSKAQNNSVPPTSAVNRIGRFLFPDDVFAEDIEIVGDLIYLLTWREEILYILDLNLKVISRRSYRGEGWGIAYDGKHFISSDGSSRLTFRDVGTFLPIKSIGVKHQGKDLKRLNALEYALGNIYANVWFDNRIYIISPKTGVVIGEINCEFLVQDNHQIAIKTGFDKKFSFTQLKENVLNGITYDDKAGIFYLTGKRWSYIYKVMLEKK